MNAPRDPMPDVLSDALSDAVTPSACVARADQLVDPHRLAALLRDPQGLILIEVGCGGRPQFELAHIPGAAYLDASELECGPLFNKVDDRALLALLLAYGIHQGATVVLYGRNVLASARAAHLMLYAGVADVRLLDGGYAHWLAAGLPCERGAAMPRVAAGAFGVVFPACPQFLTSLDDARRDLSSLVSIRTWAEFSGASSGYSYIKARGDIAGARWGRAGREGDVNSMSHYQYPDGRMLPATAIERMWEGAGIVRGRASVFYCGTGWRASLAFFYAWLMGWEQISVYEGGWFEWSAQADHPIVIRTGDSVAARFAPAPVHGNKVEL